MVITDVNIRRVKVIRPIRAIVSVTLNHEFVIHDIRVNENNGRFYVAMPSKKSKRGNFYDVAHPLTNTFREKIVEAVLDKCFQSIKLS